MKIIQKSQNGINYITGLLKEKIRVVSKAVFFKIPHDSGKEDINLKIGRYNKGIVFSRETLECENPKSELTLDNEEFLNLVDFVSQNYLPLKEGVKKYISVDENFDKELADKMRGIFSNSNQTQVLDFIVKNNLINNDLVGSLEFQKRKNAVDEFEKMLNNLAFFKEVKLKLSAKQDENVWQKFFQKNDWILGSEFVEILEERKIDTQNISDFLVKSYDGFLDIIEIKKHKDLNFWSPKLDHENLVPHQDLIKAITQSQNYLYEIEREMNNKKSDEKFNNTPIAKPRIVLIFGRSNNWGSDKKNDEKLAYRILSASYYNLTILTYDHVLDRAKRILGAEEKDELENLDFNAKND